MLFRSEGDAAIVNGWVHVHHTKSRTLSVSIAVEDDI